ncbi:MAG: hypothetical protein AAFV80_00945, partial [Bacteroidota bacterium]
MELVLTFSIAQAIIAGYILSLNLEVRKPEVYIWFFIMVGMVHLGIKLMLLAVLQDPFLFEHLTTSLSAAYGPLFYFYFRSIQEGKRPSRRSHWLHFSPLLILTLVYVAICVVLFFFQGSELLKYYKLFAILVILPVNIGYTG